MEACNKLPNTQYQKAESRSRSTHLPVVRAGVHRQRPLHVTMRSILHDAKCVR